MYYEYKSNEVAEYSGPSYVKFKDYNIKVKECNSRLEVTVLKRTVKGYVVCTKSDDIDLCLSYLATKLEGTSKANLPLFLKCKPFVHCTIVQARVNYSNLLKESLCKKMDSFSFVSSRETMSGVYLSGDITKCKEYPDGFILIWHNRIPIVMRQMERGLLQVFNPYINITIPVLFKGFLINNNLVDLFVNHTYTTTLNKYKSEYVDRILRG